MSTENVIGSQSIETFREWFKTRNGVLRWENQEIASGAARSVFTPGDKTEAPNWRYGNPTAMQPSDLSVEYSEVLESFRGRFKAMYWGTWVQPSTEAKAERLCAKHGVAKGSWRWTYEEYGLVRIEILKSRFEPFTLA